MVTKCNKLAYASVAANECTMLKSNQMAEYLDIIRFYVHHFILWAVPLLMVILKHHKLSYKRLLFLPISFSMVLGFIIVNQILQSELGFIPMRSDEFFDINYKNTSMIWGPTDGLGDIITPFVPKIFKTVPVGPYAGQEKYWPLLWLIVPMYVLLVPLAFGMCMIFDHKNFVNDCKKGITYLKVKFGKNNKVEKNQETHTEDTNN